MLLVRRFVNLTIILLVAHSCTTTTQDNSLRSQGIVHTIDIFSLSNVFYRYM